MTGDCVIVPLDDFTLQMVVRSFVMGGNSTLVLTKKEVEAIATLNGAVITKKGEKDKR